MFWFLIGATWPAPDAPLTALSPVFPDDFGTHTVFLDAGHGAPGNSGNTSAACVQEMDFTLRVAQDLAARLERTGHFEVVLSRSDDERVAYADRLSAATEASAEVFLSIHSDNRVPTGWEADPELACQRLDEGEGFTVLWSDEGALADERLRLARALGRRMTEAGFPAYRGEDYHGMYAEDPDVPGVMVDRHEMSQRIAFLRRPTMPSVIIETHHAWYLDEAKRWEEPRTLQAFADSVSAALADTLTGTRSPAP